jgi:hypothetical protein
MLKQAGSALLSTTGSLLQQASAGLQVQQSAFYASKPFSATLFPGDGESSGMRSLGRAQRRLCKKAGRRLQQLSLPSLQVLAPRSQLQ